MQGGVPPTSRCESVGPIQPSAGDLRGQELNPLGFRTVGRPAVRPVSWCRWPLHSLAVSWIADHVHIPTWLIAFGTVMFGFGGTIFVAEGWSRLGKRRSAKFPSWVPFFIKGDLRTVQPVPAILIGALSLVFAVVGAPCTRRACSSLISLDSGSTTRWSVSLLLAPRSFSRIGTSSSMV
jgi:hypothetical protein